MTTDLQALIQHLRGGDWNLRAPQEMADMIADKLEAALAAAPSTSPAAAAVAGEPERTTERHIALREAHCIPALDAYFAPRPVEDGAMSRRAFEAGFVRGFDAGEKVYTAPSACEPRMWSSGDLRAQDAAWCAGGGSFQRFDGQDHAIMAVAQWREFMLVCAKLAAPHPSPSAAEQAGRWIPVSERLPEPDVQCLVLWRAGDEYLPAIASRCVRWKRMLLWHGHAGSHNDVTHWMPLLAAPAAPSASPAEAPAGPTDEDRRTALVKIGQAAIAVGWRDGELEDFVRDRLLAAHPQPVAPAGQAEDWCVKCHVHGHQAANCEAPAGQAAAPCGCHKEGFCGAATRCQDAPSAGQAAAPEIDHQALIEYGWEHFRYRKGTKECVAFARGAVWMREQVATEAWCAEAMAGPPPDHPAWEGNAGQAAAGVQRDFRAVGWMRSDGSLHKGCPPLDEPSGWVAIGEIIPAPAVERGVAEEQTAAARDVLAERQRQISAEGWSPEHDDEHAGAEMAQAAACYALNAAGVRMSRLPEDLWPWSTDWWKPDAPRRSLVKAGALILAEIERLDRATLSTAGKEQA